MNRKSLPEGGPEGHGGSFRGFFCAFPTIVTLILHVREPCDSAADTSITILHSEAREMSRGQTGGGFEL